MLTEPSPLQVSPCSCVVCGHELSTTIAWVPDFEYGSSADELPYARCERCEHVYLRLRPDASELGRIYPPDYGNHQSSRSTSLPFRVKNWMDERLVRRLCEQLPEKPAVVDIGCADGRMLAVCQAAIPQSGPLLGVEISELAARGARERGFDVKVGTVEQVELRPASADLIFLQQVIEHVYEPDRVLEKLARTLTPGGLLLLETPCVGALDARIFGGRHWGGYHAPRHFNLFSESTLTRLVEHAGLEVVEIGHTPQPIHWVWSLRHLLADRGLPAWTYRSLALNNAGALAIGTALELCARVFTGRMSNMRVILRRRPD